jgi:murein DD-endopeptidase MepM/ murein hydrolase activator NlpD
METGGLAALNGQRRNRPIVDLGDEDPLYTRNIASGPPDRRRVSLRWLAGSVLTGIFSATLVGGALQAAVGLEEYVVVRPAAAHGAFAEGTPVAVKGDRFRPVPESKVSRSVIQISTVTRSGDRDIVRVRPYAHVHTNLAAPVEEKIAVQVPAFNAAEVFTASEDEAAPVDVAASDSIYGAEVDGEVAIKVVSFPLSGADYEASAKLDVAEVAQIVREAAPDLADGSVEVASLPYVDPARFEMASAEAGALNALAVAITQENVSLLEKSDEDSDLGIEETVLQVDEGDSLRNLLTREGATEEAAARIQSALVANFTFDFRAGQKLRIGLAPDPDTGSIRPVRVSLYQPDDRHVATVALSDNSVYVAAQEPALDAELVVVEEMASPPSVLPTLHEGLWGTGLALDIPKEVLKNISHIFSYDADQQTRLSPTDSLEVIYAADSEAANAEILYASLRLGSATHSFYRFRSPEDGSVDYYDAEGKSAQKFLIRKPVTQARFTSGFGMRRHPIVKRYRMHSGVDWAAPTGTPIMAGGDGTVEEIGTRSGYGRSITLKHLHGYKTTYNHMSGYIKGLQRGDKVSQGQVIGYVGSTGLSTGPHLHYEVMVNDRFVDPMKIRVPRGRELQGAEMVAFEQERMRIDELIEREEGRVAASESD